MLVGCLCVCHCQGLAQHAFNHSLLLVCGLSASGYLFQTRILREQVVAHYYGHSGSLGLVHVHYQFTDDGRDYIQNHVR